MNDSQKARRSFLWSILISTGVCLFVYIYRGWLFNTVTLKITSVWDAMIGFNRSDELLWAEIFWRVINIILYFVCLGVCAILRLGENYEGKLLAIPGMYVLYLVLNLVLVILTWF